MSTPRVQRECGPCTACCTTHRILELDKKAGVRCPHVRQKKCSIYGNHPPSCKVYACAWLIGGLPEEERPDRSGMVMDIRAAKYRGKIFRFCEMFEVREGASKEVKHKQAIVHLVDNEGWIVGLHKLGSSKVTYYRPSSINDAEFSAILAEVDGVIEKMVRALTPPQQL